MMESKKTARLALVDSFLDRLAVGIIYLLLALVVVGVILRYVFHMYAPFTGEVPRSAMVVLTFLLAGLLWKHKRHVTLDFLFIQFSSKVRYILDVIFVLGGLFCGGLWLLGSIQLLVSDILQGAITIEMEVSWVYYHIFLILGFALFTFYMIVELVKLISHPHLRSLKGT